MTDSDTRYRRTVVVGVDGSDEALRAVRFAAAEAARRRVPLRVMNAFGWVDEPTGGAAYRDVLLVRARQLVAAAAAVAVETVPGIVVEQQVVVGFPVPVLVDESRRARLLVLGAHGLTLLDRLLVGSVSAALAAHARCPVVVVRGRVPDPALPVLVGIDGTPASEAALAFALDAAAARGVPLVAVHAWSTPRPSTRTNPDGARCQAHQVLSERLAGWGEKYPDVAVRRVAAEGRAAPVLVRESEGAQLAVVGSRGRGPVAAAVLGSVAHVLVHRSACPVAVVRPDPVHPPEAHRNDEETTPCWPAT